MGENEIWNIVVGDLEYDGVRVTDDGPLGLGYIELRQKGGGPRVARITSPGPDQPMELYTYGGGLPRPVVEWLLEKADLALA